MSKSFIISKYYEKKDSDKKDFEGSSLIHIYGLHQTINGKQVDCELPELKSDHKFAILFPSNFNEESYAKGFVECVVNLLIDATSCLNIAEEKAKKHQVPLQLTILMKEVAAILQWTIHSVSWGEGELQKFDIDEIRRKLKVRCGIK